MSQLFVLIWDQAFFKTLFFPGDRADDLGRVKTQELVYCPQKEGLLFKHVLTKTLCDGTSNLFSLKCYGYWSLHFGGWITGYFTLTRLLTLSNNTVVGAAVQSPCLDILQFSRTVWSLHQECDHQLALFIKSSQDGLMYWKAYLTVLHGKQKGSKCRSSA